MTVKLKFAMAYSTLSGVLTFQHSGMRQNPMPLVQLCNDKGNYADNLW